MLVRIYGVYQDRTGHVSVDTLVESSYMTAGLLPEKTRALLPRSDDFDESFTDEELETVDEEAIMKFLARYRPLPCSVLLAGRKTGAREALFSPPALRLRAARWRPFGASGLTVSSGGC